MTLKRRHFFGLGAAAASSLVIPIQAAEAFPRRTVPGFKDEVVIARPDLVKIDIETLNYLDWLKEHGLRMQIAGVSVKPGCIVIADDITVPLMKKHIDVSSFRTNPVDLILTHEEGFVTFVKGTPVNFDADGDGIPDSIRTVVNYRCRG